MFECNGLFLETLSFGDDTISFTFADTYNKQNYECSQMHAHGCDNLSPVSAEFRFIWVSSGGNNLAEISVERNIDYENPQRFVFRKLPEYKGAKSIIVSLSIEGKLICYVEHPLGELSF